MDTSPHASCCFKFSLWEQLQDLMVRVFYPDDFIQKVVRRGPGSGLPRAAAAKPCQDLS